MTQFVIELWRFARRQERPVFAIDFEPDPKTGLNLTVRFNARPRSSCP